MEKIKKHFYLPESDINWLKNYQEKYHLSTLSAALSHLIREYKEGEPNDTENRVLCILAARITDEIMPTVKRILAASNHIDKTVTVNQMLLNSLSGYSDFQSLYEVPSEQLQRAEKLWKQRKDELRQKAIDRKKETDSGGDS